MSTSSAGVQRLPLPARPKPKLTLAKLEQIKAYLTSHVMPSFDGESSMHASRKQNFRRTCEVYFIATEEPWKGRVCTTEALLRERARRDGAHPSRKRRKGSCCCAYVVYLLSVGEANSSKGEIADESGLALLHLLPLLLILA